MKNNNINRINALYADARGEIFDAPLTAAARVGNSIVRLKPSELIKLPGSADLMFMPDRRALAFDRRDRIMPLEGNAVAALLPAGFTRTHLPAFDRSKIKTPLPLFGYTAVVLYRDELHAAAIYTDENHKWEPGNYNTPELRQKIKRVRHDLPNNRIVEQLARCSLEWHCLTAQNLFYRRWEAGLPTSPTCNARCLGCISLQQSECCPSPQSRIQFKPSVEEIAAIGIYHLSTAPEAIVSFGQGCEGEPTLAAERIAEAIKLIRSKTPRGQININSNAGFTDGLKKIVDAGLDSIRVSIISARADSYDAYYRANYSLDDVKNSIRYALEQGVFVSLNLLYFPGFNDRRAELDAWLEFLTEFPIQMIQLRNLNIDPDYFLKLMPPSNEKPLGTRQFISTIKNRFPHIQIGNFSHYTKE